MTYRDDHESPAPNSPHAMVGSQPAQAALVPHTNGLASSVIYPASHAAAPATDVLRGGMDANSFINCLRRRWLLALCMGLVMAVTTAGTLWFLFPESSMAQALFSVSSQQESILGNSARSGNKDFEILQRTQLAYLKSYFVIQAALRTPGMESLGVLAGEPDKVQWLIEQLTPSFQNNSEILSISLTGDSDYAEELRQLVNAVAKAYENEVVFKEEQRRGLLRDALARSLAKISDEIKSKLDEHNALAEELHVVDARQRDPKGIDRFSRAHGAPQRPRLSPYRTQRGETAERHRTPCPRRTIGCGACKSWRTRRNSELRIIAPSPHPINTGPQPILTVFFR